MKISLHARHYGHNPSKIFNLTLDIAEPYCILRQSFFTQD
jgi:hypothetical protein